MITDNDAREHEALYATLRSISEDKHMRRCLVESKFEWKCPVACHLESHDDFLLDKLQQIMTEPQVIQIDTEHSGVRHVIYRTNARIGPPVSLGMKSTYQPTYPADCRVRGTTYSGLVFATVVHEIWDIRTDAAKQQNTKPRVVYTYEDVCHGNLPIMVKSKLCRLRHTTRLCHECPFSYGGILIVNGKPRTFHGQRSVAPNHIIVFRSNKISSTGTTSIGSAATAAQNTAGERITKRAPALFLHEENVHSQQQSSSPTGMSSLASGNSIIASGNNHETKHGKDEVPFRYDMLTMEFRSQHPNKIRSTATLVMNLSRAGDCTTFLPFSKCAIPPAVIFRTLGITTLGSMLGYILPPPWNTIPSLRHTATIALCRFLGHETTVNVQNELQSPHEALAALETEAFFDNTTPLAEVPKRLARSIALIQALNGAKQKSQQAGRAISLIRSRAHALIWIAVMGGGSTLRRNPALGVGKTAPKDDIATRVRNLTHIFVNEFLPHVAQGDALEDAALHRHWSSTFTTVERVVTGPTSVFIGISTDDEATLERKRWAFGQCLREICAVSCGLMEPHDPKNIANERIELNGRIIALYFRQLFREGMKRIQKAIRRHDTRGEAINLKEIIEEQNPMSIMHRGFNSGNFSSSTNSLSGKNLSMAIAPGSGPGTLGLQARLTSMINTKGNSLQQRQPHQSEQYVVCPSDSPEGAVCAQIRAQTIGTHIRVGFDARPILLMAARLGLFGINQPPRSAAEDPTVDDTPCRRPMDTEVFMNGLLVGRTRRPVALVAWLRRNRGRKLPFDLEVAECRDLLRVQIWTDVGAAMYPVFVLDRLHLWNKIVAENKAHLTETLWRELVMQGVILFVGKDEETNYRIAESHCHVIDQFRVRDQIFASNQGHYVIPALPTDRKPTLEEMNWRQKVVDAEEPFTHVNVDAALMQSPFASQQPFPDRNHGARNTLQLSMGKQQVGLSTLAPLGWCRTKKYYQSFYPQRPITSTLATRALTKDILSSTFWAFVLVCPDGNKNSEDAITTRDGFFQMGSAHSETLSTVIAQESSASTRNDIIVFSKPVVGKCVGMQDEDRYEHLDVNGFPRIGARILPGDAVVGMVMTSTITHHIATTLESEQQEHDEEQRRQQQQDEEDGVVHFPSPGDAGTALSLAPKRRRVGTNTSSVAVAQTNRRRTTILRDVSIFHKSEQPSTIAKVALTLDRENRRNVIITLRTTNIPTVGDKYVMRHGQKGVNGCSRSDVDMPFTHGNVSNGEPSVIVPDVLMNPHMWISRMTTGLSSEMVAGLLAVLTGQTADSSIYQSDHMGRHGTSENFVAALTDLGLTNLGDRIWYDGCTGERIQGTIFGGFVSYQRLHHFAESKEYARSIGPIHPSEHQPTDGRVRDGGLKNGEMERDGLAGHGQAITVKETLVDKSALSEVVFCRRCGVMAEPARPGATTDSFTGMVLRAAYPFCRNCGKHDQLESRSWNHIATVLNNEIQGISGIWRYGFDGQSPIITTLQQYPPTTNGKSGAMLPPAKRRKVTEVSPYRPPPPPKDYLFTSQKSIPIGASLSLSALEEDMWLAEQRGTADNLTATHSSLSRSSHRQRHAMESGQVKTSHRSRPNNHPSPSTPRYDDEHHRTHRNSLVPMSYEGHRYQESPGTPRYDDELQTGRNPLIPASYEDRPRTPPPLPYSPSAPQYILPPSSPTMDEIEATSDSPHYLPAQAAPSSPHYSPTLLSSSPHYSPIHTP